MHGCSARSAATSAVPWLFRGAFARGTLGIFVHDVGEGSTKSIEGIAGSGLSSSGFALGHGRGRGKKVGEQEFGMLRFIVVWCCLPIASRRAHYVTLHTKSQNSHHMNRPTPSRSLYKNTYIVPALIRPYQNPSNNRPHVVTSTSCARISM